MSDAFGTALWAIDFLFTNAQNGSTGANFHGGGDGTGYTPIADDNGNVVGARPLFYGIFLFARRGRGQCSRPPARHVAELQRLRGRASAGHDERRPLQQGHSTTVHATVDVGEAITSATATHLPVPRSGRPRESCWVERSIQADGGFAPNAPEPPPTSGLTLRFDLPPASAVLISVQ